ncbi:MAG: hypothetical protein CGW95_12235 [Phenylobacterium zucineum]|nr:MAG: hypothetical protein CGW95_12235 [Phenylobacterium zucineum]
MADNVFNSTTSTTPNGTTFNLSGLSDPAKMTVDPTTQTVAGQLSSVMSADSPLIQQARTRAAQSMNQRGLSNSSMALSAADSAAYDAAMPIATADANIYNDAAKLNTTTQNQFNLANNGQAFDLQKAALGQQYTKENLATQQANTMQTLAQQQANTLQTMGTQQGFDLAKMDKQAANTLSQMSAQQQNDLARMATQQGYTLENMSAQQINDLAKIQAQSTAQAETAKAVAGIEASYKNLTQGSAAATSILGKMQDSLNALMANKDITNQATRDAMAADIKANATDALNLVGALAGNMDLSKYIDSVFAVPGTTPATTPTNPAAPAAPTVNPNTGGSST